MVITKIWWLLMVVYANKKEEITRNVYLIVKNQIDRIINRGYGVIVEPVNRFYLGGIFVVKDPVPRDLLYGYDPEIVGTLFKGQHLKKVLYPDINLKLSDIYAYADFYLKEYSGRGDKIAIYLATMRDSVREDLFLHDLYTFDELKDNKLLEITEEILDLFILYGESNLGLGEHVDKDNKTLLGKNIEMKLEHLRCPYVYELLMKYGKI